MASSGDPVTAVRQLSAEARDELLATACEAAGTQLLRASLRSVHHRSGRSVSWVHEATLRIGDEDREVLLVVHVDARRLPDGAFVLTRGGHRVAVWRFPHDPFLVGLPSAIDPGRVREMLDGLGAPAGEVRLHTRAYRPARRGVVEVHLDGESAGRIVYLKVLTGTRASELAGIHRTLSPHIPVPRVVGVAASQGILAMEALAGATLGSALHGALRLPEPDALVELSDRIAASGVSSRRDPRAFADPSRHVDVLCALVPDRADDVVRIVDDVSTLDGPLVGVHGDMHGGQLLLGDDGTVTGVLDVDGAGRGLMAHDAGNLVAHLDVLGEIHPQVANRASTYAAAVADAYRERVGTRALAQATAAAWIGLATGPHRAQDADWPERTRRRIDRARAALADR